MKIGVKTYDDIKYCKHFEKSADFLEIMAIEGRDFSFLKNYSKPIVIHAEHQGFGINPADKTTQEKNINSLKFAIKLASELNARKIIVHPGELKNKGCSEEEAVSLIKSLDNEKILIENMPFEKNYPNLLCRTPKEIKNFLKKTNAGFCLDINHAISVAITLKKDFYEFLEQLISLKPSHYHLGGQKTKFSKPEEPANTHQSFKNSDIDVKKILSLLPKDAEITLETTTSAADTEYDIDYIRKLI